MKLKTMQLIYSTRNVVHWIWGTVGWGRGGGRRKDYKGTRGNFGKKWLCSFSLLWQWFHRCLHLSKHIKLYTLHVVYYTYLYLSNSVKKKKRERERNKTYSLTEACRCHLNSFLSISALMKMPRIILI